MHAALLKFVYAQIAQKWAKGKNHGSISEKCVERLTRSLEVELEEFGGPSQHLAVTSNDDSIV